MIAPTVGKVLALDSLFFNQRKKQKILNILIVSLLFLSVNGNMSMLYALAVALFLFSGLNNFLFTPTKKKNTLKRSVLLILASIILIPTAMFGYIVGESVKRGLPPQNVVEWVISESNTNVNWIRNLILERISPTAISTIHIMQTDWRATDESKNFNFLVILETGMFRLSNALGIEDEIGLRKNVDGTVSRVNYLEINTVPSNEREGTSAGPVASFYYCFGDYLAPIFFILYFFLVINILRRIDKYLIKNLSFLGMLFLLDTLSGLFMAPMDIFLILDDAMFFLSLLLLLIFTKRKINRNNINVVFYETKSPVRGVQ